MNFNEECLTHNSLEGKSMFNKLIILGNDFNIENYIEKYNENLLNIQARIDSVLYGDKVEKQKSKRFNSFNQKKTTKNNLSEKKKKIMLKSIETDENSQIPTKLLSSPISKNPQFTGTSSNLFSSKNQDKTKLMIKILNSHEKFSIKNTMNDAYPSSSSFKLTKGDFNNLLNTNTNNYFNKNKNFIDSPSKKPLKLNKIFTPIKDEKIITKTDQNMLKKKSILSKLAKRWSKETDFTKESDRNKNLKTSDSNRENKEKLNKKSSKIEEFSYLNTSSDAKNLINSKELSDSMQKDKNFSKFINKKLEGRNINKTVKPDLEKSNFNCTSFVNNDGSRMYASTKNTTELNSFSIITKNFESGKSIENNCKSPKEISFKKQNTLSKESSLNITEEEIDSHREKSNLSLKKLKLEENQTFFNFSNTQNKNLNIQYNSNIFFYDKKNNPDKQNIFKGTNINMRNSFLSFDSNVKKLCEDTKITNSNFTNTSLNLNRGNFLPKIIEGCKNLENDNYDIKTNLSKAIEKIYNNIDNSSAKKNKYVKEFDFELNLNDVFLYGNNGEGYYMNNQKVFKEGKILNRLPCESILKHKQFFKERFDLKTKKESKDLKNISDGLNMYTPMNFKKVDEYLKETEELKKKNIKEIIKFKNKILEATENKM